MQAKKTTRLAKLLRFKKYLTWYERIPYLSMGILNDASVKFLMTIAQFWILLSLVNLILKCYGSLGTSMLNMCEANHQINL